MDRSWSAEELRKELKSLLKDTEMEYLSSEIVKNHAGTVLSPNILNGKKVMLHCYSSQYHLQDIYLLDYSIAFHTWMGNR